MKPRRPLFFLAAIGLAIGAACAPQDRIDPVIVEADAWCDDAGEWWSFWAQVDHPEGPRAVAWVVMEAALEVGDGQLDSVYLADLEYQAEGEWFGELENGTTALDCDAPEPYAYLFTAQDTEGRQGTFDVYEALEE